MSTDASAERDRRIVELLDIYLAQVQEGRAPARSVFLDAHPELAAELEPCLDTLDVVAGCHADFHAAGETTPDHGLGRELGDFRLIREIGRGGMGIVYEAEQLSLSRRVALKVLPFAAVLDPRRLQRFKNEALAAANLNHPHIVDVYGVGCERGVHYYVMHYVEGMTLADVIAARKQRAHTVGGRPRTQVEHPSQATAPPTAGRGVWQDVDTESIIQAAINTVDGLGPRDLYRRVAELGIDAAEALEHAHQMGVVHRDIKPSNLLIDQQGLLWVTDFGLALVDSDASLTLTGDVLGTLRYMSPEQLAGQPAMIDHRTDVYSLGATLYELATGCHVVRGGERAAILREIADVEPTRPRSIVPDLPRDLETILLHALAKEPAARYPSAIALAEDLRRFLEDRPIKATPTTILQACVKWSRRHIALVGALCATLLVISLITGAAFLLLSSAYQRERSESQRAADNLALALDALDRTYLKFAERIPTHRGLNDEDREFLANALRFYEQFAQRNVGATQASRETLKAYRRIGEIQRELGDLTEAERALRTACDSASRMASESEADVELLKERVAAHYQLGDLLRVTQRLDDAQRELLRARDFADVLRVRAVKEKSSLEPSINLALGQLLVQQGMYAESLVPMRLGVSGVEEKVHASPADPAVRAELCSAYWNLFRVLVRLEDHREIASSAERVLEVFPDWWSKDHLATEFYAHALLFAKQDPELSGSEREAVAQDYRERTQSMLGAWEVRLPDAASLADLAWFLGTWPDAEFRNPARALPYAQRAVEMAPEVSMHWTTLGAVYFRSGQPDKAIPALERSLEAHDVQRTYPYTYLALSYAELNQLDEARLWLDKAEDWLNNGERFKDHPKYRLCAEAKALIESRESESP